MEKKSKLLDGFLRLVSYILVAALASGVTFLLCSGGVGISKLDQLAGVIDAYFIGESDTTAMEDAAAAAMIGSLGDRWSYYIPAADYQDHLDQMNNSYVGIGVTVGSVVENGGIQILQVEPNGGAKQAGVQVGDILTHVDGNSIADMELSAVKELIRGEAGTQVSLTVLRGTETITMQVSRQVIQMQVARGEMLEGQIGLVTIKNFDERCADETIAVINQLCQQGAKSLIFDVRFNPGGYKKEVVRVLDYLLPEGLELFHSVYYNRQEERDYSDAQSLDLPIAVLINGSSYSAAEFFAATLDEYDRAILVGEPTVGKSYFQTTIKLNDGSAVGLSIGKYYTPNGKSLADEGGLRPEVSETVDQTTAAKIYAGQLAPEDDPQIQAAVDALQKAS